MIETSTTLIDFCWGMIIGALITNVAWWIRKK